MSNEPVAWIKQNPETLEAELHFDKPAKYWATVVSNPDIPLYTHQYERPHNTVLVPCDKLAEMQAEIEALKAEIEAMRNRFTLAFWHDTFVEVKKPNSDLIYRFKLDETNDS